MKDKKILLENYVRKITEQVLREQFESGVIDEATFGRLMKGLGNVGSKILDKSKEVGSKLSKNVVNKASQISSKVKSSIDGISKSIDDAKTSISNAYTVGEMEDIKLDIEKFVKKAAELVAEYNVKAEKVGGKKITLTGTTNKVAPTMKRKVTV